MLRFDDRFARQNRCEPPPEFPLASPYPGIVHHLSGPALTLLLKSIRKHQDRSMMRRSSHLRSLSLRVRVLHPNTRNENLDSLVRVSRRVADDHYASILADARTSVRRQGMTHWAITLPEEPRSQNLYPPARTDAGLSPAECTGENTG